MNIQRLQVTIEPFRYVLNDAPDFLIFKVKVLPYPGEELHLDKVIHQDDLHSLWDIIWVEMGRQIQAGLLR